MPPNVPPSSPVPRAASDSPSPQVLAQEGHALTVNARRPDKLASARRGARAAWAQTCTPSPATWPTRTTCSASSPSTGRLRPARRARQLRGHRRRARRSTTLDTKRVDLQLDVNLRAPILLYRESVDLLKAAGHEHRGALVVNVASISAKRGARGCRSTARPRPVCRLHRGDERGAQRRRHQVRRARARVGGHADDRLHQGAGRARGDDPTQDVAESVRFLLKLSPNCVDPGDRLPASGRNRCRSRARSVRLRFSRSVG